MIPYLYEHLLTIAILSPLLGVVMLLFVPKRDEDAANEIAAVSGGLTLFLSLLIFALFRPEGQFAFEGLHGGIPALGTSYHVAVDGLSVLLIPAAAFIIFFSVIINWRAFKSRQREIFGALLVFESAMIGFFASVDLMCMYVFLETGIVAFGFAMMLLSGRDIRLSRFAGFMSFSSALFLAIVVFLTLAAESSDLAAIQGVNIAPHVQNILFVMLLVFTMCRSGIFPLHGWVRGIAGESVDFRRLPLCLIFISGVYLFYRLLPSFAAPLEAFRPCLLWIVAASVAIPALIALGEKGFSGLFLYVFMVHFALILLGFVSVTPQGLAGAGIQMVSVTISISAVALVFALRRRRGTPAGEERFEGAFAGSPVFAFLFMIIMLALAGTPVLSHFPGLFMIWMGLFKGSWVLAVVSLGGVVLIAVALTRAFALAFYPGDETASRGRGPRLSEILLISPFVLLIIVIGIFPDILLRYIEQSTEVVWQIFSRQI